VTARYLAALLGEASAPGITDRTVIRVALQQRDFGEPLDDLIVDFGSGTDEARLSLQLKRSLTISAAATNTDFRDIIRDGWATLAKPGFRNDVDRIGCATEDVATKKSRDLRALCDFARASDTVGHFEERFTDKGNASKAHGQIREDVATLLTETIGRPCTADEVYRFLRHFVLLTFDFMQEGAAGPGAVTDQLRLLIAPGDVAKAPLLWDRLCRLARIGAGRSEAYGRRTLIVNLSAVARLNGTASLSEDIARLGRLQHSWLLDIEDDVRGTRLDRPSAARELAEALGSHRFIQIQGLAGSGKSVLLRRQIEGDLLTGPVLFLKSDRLEGNSWLRFATALGLKHTDPADLLVEIGAMGQPRLFIDGIDRIELENRGVVSDLLRLIANDSALANWSVIATLRDTGVEPLRTWLPSSLVGANGIGVVSVDRLDDEEAEALAAGQPALRRLLFGARPVREIVRRPFFAKILCQNFAADGGDQDFEPSSEIDLIANWWQRGGFNAEGQHALQRQMALLELGERRAQRLSEPIALASLKPSTTDMVAGLVADGVLQFVRAGLSVRFSHDIFFEWSFFHQLLGSEKGWVGELAAAGEPPVIGRIVELVSQSEFADGDRWSAMLREAEASSLRSQWVRAWLLGPIAAPNFDTLESGYLGSLYADDHRLLRKLLVWFQAERTIPNSAILRGLQGGEGLSADARIRAADLLGWPSDLETWSRLILLLLKEAAELPVWIVPEIASIFDVWQNAYSYLPNPISTAITAQVDAWLRSIESRKQLAGRWKETSADEPPEDTWEGLRSSRGDLEEELRRILLRSARSSPDIVGEYLDYLRDKDRLLAEVFPTLAGWAVLLSQTHPQKLADLTRIRLCKELPQEREERHRQEAEMSAQWRREALAKPEAERTRRDELAIAGMFSRIGHSGFSTMDWEDLSVDGDRMNYFPASPLREPFKSLFAHAPAEAIRVVTEVSNHAVTAWRQLHELDPRRQGTPIPLRLNFPWGEQEFWGTPREYLWSRGLWGPKPLLCAYLAMENWIVGELEQGRPADEVIRQILEGNDCVAAVQLAMFTAISSRTASDTVQVLINSLRVWDADVHRSHQELSIASSSQIGFMRADDLPHAQAVKELNERAAHGQDVRQLAAAFVLAGDANRAAVSREAIEGFRDQTVFYYREQEASSAEPGPDTSFGAEMAHWANVENYRRVAPSAEEAPEQIVFVNPEADTPEGRRRLEAAQSHLTDHALYQWSRRALEKGDPPSGLAMPDVVAQARRLDGAALFGAQQGQDLDIRRGAIAAVAAVVLVFRDLSTAEQRDWARGVTDRAATMCERKDPFWTSAAIIPWHPGLFATQALAADIRAGEDSSRAIPTLFELAVHPLETVSMAAFAALFGLWDIRPRLALCALGLGLALCIDRRQKGGLEESDGYAGFDPAHDHAHRMKLARDAVRQARGRGALPGLELPGRPWSRAQIPGPRKWRWRFWLPVPTIDDPSAPWQASPEVWDSQLCAKLLAMLPLPAVMRDPQSRLHFTSFATRMLNWTIESIAPDWDPRGYDADRNGPGHYEWIEAFGSLLGRLAGELDPDSVDQQILSPIVAVAGDRPCFSLLAPLVDMFTRAHVMDPVQIAASTDIVLARGTERFLASRVLQRTSYEAGKLTNEMPRLANALLFIAVEDAQGATRFANGDWTDIGIALPAAGRLAREAGWSSSVMGKYLTLCERAGDLYPANAFADQVDAVLTLGEEGLSAWRSTLLAARIAVRVQRISERETPLPEQLARKLLRILDQLIDLGDRRSAALQISEVFREVKLS